MILLLLLSNNEKKILIILIGLNKVRYTPKTTLPHFTL